jgi:hypothetical protein
MPDEELIDRLAPLPHHRHWSVLQWPIRPDELIDRFLTSILIDKHVL